LKPLLTLIKIQNKGLRGELNLPFQMGTVASQNKGLRGGLNLGFQFRTSAHLNTNESITKSNAPREPIETATMGELNKEKTYFLNEGQATLLFNQ